jgi:hypothetical protein
MTSIALYLYIIGALNMFFFLRDDDEDAGFTMTTTLIIMALWPVLVPIGSVYGVYTYFKGGY